jgi:N-acyl-D-amino-acid deacylase
MPALAFRLNDRGLLRPGYAADVVLFDPKTVTDKATFEQPHQYSKGMAYITVNGTLVMDKEKMTGSTPGGPLYGPGWDGAKKNPATTQESPMPSESSPTTQPR